MAKAGRAFAKGSADAAGTRQEQAKLLRQQRSQQKQQERQARAAAKRKARDQQGR